MSYRLFLDDERMPTQVHWVKYPFENYNGAWVIVRNYDDFVEMIKDHGMPSFISFDHDLADEHYVHGGFGDAPEYGTYREKTGYEAAKWLRNYCNEMDIPVPPFVAHSMNPIGRANIVQALMPHREV